MKRDFRDELATFLEQARPELPTKHELEFKNVFGAVAGYVNGQIFITRGKFGTALKLPDDTLSLLFREPDVQPLRYFANGHVKKEYAVLPGRILEDPHRLSDLVHESIEYVLANKKS